MSLVTFFFTYPTTTEIYTLSLHDALPIYRRAARSGQTGRVHRARLHRRLSRPTDERPALSVVARRQRRADGGRHQGDRKSTRLNSSHTVISYAVFCLKKKKKQKKQRP